METCLASVYLVRGRFKIAYTTLRQLLLIVSIFYNKQQIIDALNQELAFFANN